MDDGQPLFDRALLVRRRERVAMEAARHEFLLERVGRELADRLTAIRRRFPIVLNLGAHHGFLGRQLRRLPGIEMVIESDPSSVLLAQCEGPRVQMDEEALAFADQSLDLVVSGLALQFVNDLPGTLVQIRRALKPDGLLLATMLGGSTLRELRTALLLAEEEAEGGVSPRVAPFADVRELGALLQRAGFALPVTDADAVTVTYPSPVALLHELRAMGGTNVLRARRKQPLRRATLQRAMEIYFERFGLDGVRIPATFELVTLTGWAPHESQQKPLRPGAAKMRLADVLGTSEQSAGERVRARKQGR